MFLEVIPEDRLVCYVTSLTPYIDDKSPVKISKYSIGHRYGSTSLEMNNKTFCKDVSKPNFEPDQGKENEIVSLGNSNNIAAEQLITVKAKNINLSEAKVVPLMKLFESGRYIFLIPQEHQNCFCGRRVVNNL